MNKKEEIILKKFANGMPQETLIEENDTRIEKVFFKNGALKRQVSITEKNHPHYWDNGQIIFIQEIDEYNSNGQKIFESREDDYGFTTEKKFYPNGLIAEIYDQRSQKHTFFDEQGTPFIQLERVINGSPQKTKNIKKITPHKYHKKIKDANKKGNQSRENE